MKSPTIKELESMHWRLPSEWTNDELSHAYAALRRWARDLRWRKLRAKRRARGGFKL